MSLAINPQLLLTSAEVPAFLEQHGALRERLGGAADGWDVEELTGGVINSCWSVRRKGGSANDGVGGGVIVKQAPPYVRVVGPSFPLSTERMRVEAAAMGLVGGLCPASVPQPLLYDAANHLLVMPLVPPPHRPLVEAIWDGEVFPGLAQQLARLLATMFASSSAAAMGAEAHARAVEDFRNSDIVAANEQVVLLGPFTPGDPSNSWLPELEDEVQALWGDAPAMAAAAAALGLYRGSKECLIHNDLHAGNLLVTRDSLWLLDWEFATFGPPTYDLGSLVASLLMGFVAAGGAAATEPEGGGASSSGGSGGGGGSGGRAEQRAWLLNAVEEVWALTVDEWWQQAHTQAQQHAAGNGGGGGGGGAPHEASGSGGGGGGGGSSGDGQGKSRAAWEARVVSETLMFAGCCMCRLVVGQHSYALFAGMRDPGTRACCERAALRIGRRLLAEAAQLPSMRGATELAAAEVAACSL